MLPSGLHHQPGTESGITGPYADLGPGTSGVAGALQELQTQAHFPGDSRDPGNIALKGLTNGRKVTTGAEPERTGYLRRGTAGLN